MARLFLLIHRGYRWLARSTRSQLLRLGVWLLKPEIQFPKNKIMLISKMTRVRLSDGNRDLSRIALHSVNRTDADESDKPSSASLNSEISIRVHLSVAALRLLSYELSANRRDWRLFSMRDFAKHGCRIGRVDGLASVGATDFLAERLVRFPKELSESYKPGFTSLGGLGRCHWLAWRVVVQLCDPGPSRTRQVPTLPFNTDRSFFDLARRLAIAHGIKVVLERGLSIAACLVRTGRLNVIYIDDAVDQEYQSFLVYHELAHFLLDHQGVSSRFFLEGPQSESVLELQEMQADALASVLDHLMRGLAGIADVVGTSTVSSQAVLPVTKLRGHHDRTELQAALRSAVHSPTTQTHRSVP